MAAYQNSLKITFSFKNKANGSLMGTETFGKHEDAMDMIKFLNSRAPIQEGVQYYNLHKGPNGASPISYMELSEKNIEQLNLANNETLFFSVDGEPAF